MIGIAVRVSVVDVDGESTRYREAEVSLKGHAKTFQLHRLAVNSKVNKPNQINSLAQRNYCYALIYLHSYIKLLEQSTTRVLDFSTEKVVRNSR